jgi:hypothetical protein
VVEGLESRQLLAFSSLGLSLPDLTVSGFASPVASWGQPVAVSVTVQNIGSNTSFEPLPTVPNPESTFSSASSADAPASTVAVYAVPSQRNGTTTKPPTSLSGAVLVGTVSIPAITQNNSVTVPATITLPSQPAGFPGDGGNIFFVFKANAGGQVLESDTTNNVSTPFLVQIEAPLPELAAVGLDVPPTMQPGDTIQPNIQIANFGTVDSDTQGPFQVALVASTTPFVTSGSTILAVYTVNNVPGQQNVPTRSAVFSVNNSLTPPDNVVTITGDPITLPTSPATYFIGVVVDPTNQIKQINKVPQFARPANPFSLVHSVGPPIAGLPPAGVVVSGGAANTPIFPNAIDGVSVGASASGTFPAPFPPTLNVLNTSTVTPAAAASPSAAHPFARRQAILSLRRSAAHASAAAHAAAIEQRREAQAAHHAARVRN